MASAVQKYFAFREMCCINWLLDSDPQTGLLRATLSGLKLATQRTASGFEPALMTGKAREHQSVWWSTLLMIPASIILLNSLSLDSRMWYGISKGVLEWCFLIWRNVSISSFTGCILTLSDGVKVSLKHPSYFFKNWPHNFLHSLGGAFAFDSIDFTTSE